MSGIAGTYHLDGRPAGAAELSRMTETLAHLEDGTYYGLNAVGARIWDLIQEPTPVREVCEQLVREYDVETETCQRDLMAVLRDLADHHLIEIRGDEGR